MGIRVLRENAGSRTPGYKVASGVSVYPGVAVVLSAIDTITLYDANTNQVLGLALDSNVQFPMQNTDPDTQAGEGFDYTNYNRGGLIAVINNAEVELFDDERAAAGASHPVVYGDTFALNGIVYADATTGKITTEADGGANLRVGRVTGITGTDVSTVLRIIIEA